MDTRRTYRDARRDVGPLPWCPAPRASRDHEDPAVDHRRSLRSEPGLRVPGPGTTDPRAPVRGRRPSEVVRHPVLPWLPDTAPPEPAPAPVPAPWGFGAGSPVDRPAWLRTGRRFVAAASVVALVLAAAVAVTMLTRRADRTVSTPFLSYTAPSGWTAEATGSTTPIDTPALIGTMRGPGYDCGGESSVRGYAAAALLPADTSAGSAPADRAERLARWFATASYTASDGTAPQLTVAPARPVRVAGPDGPVDATVTEVAARVAGHGTCVSGGTVLALAAPVSGGAALLLVAGDTDGGPAEPAPPDRATLDAVLASVSLGPG